MKNYDILKKYDNDKLDHNWIHVKDIYTEKEGIVVLSNDNNVKIYIGADNGEDDKVITQEEFNTKYTIILVTDHFGETIDEWNVAN